jgi:catechol 2,3-dioxygenase-like lactoylglutathione lyase family enzyme
MRMLHTMLRVGDLERSLRFYCDVLGMRELRRKDYLSGRFTLAFVGCGHEDTHTVLELTHNWAPTATISVPVMDTSRSASTTSMKPAARSAPKAGTSCASPGR